MGRAWRFHLALLPCLSPGMVSLVFCCTLLISSDFPLISVGFTSEFLLWLLSLLPLNVGVHSGVLTGSHGHRDFLSFPLLTPRSVYSAFSSVHWTLAQLRHHI